MTTSREAAPDRMHERAIRYIFSFSQMTKQKSDKPGLPIIMQDAG